MKISDLMKRKKTRVRVRVPAKLQAKLGEAADGTVQDLVLKKGITWVRVKLTGRPGVHNFRPQDLSPR